MFRYMAFAWNDSNAAQRASAQLLASRLRLATHGKWTSTLRSPGLNVFDSGSRPGAGESHPLPHDAGVILGTLFESGAQSGVACSKKTFSATETDRMLATGCRSMCTDYWGKYVAFARDASRHTTFILRDPTGGLPCFHASFRDVDLYFSSAEDCARLGLLSLSVDWGFIAQHVASRASCTPRTAINEISCVLAGEQIQIQGDRTERSLVWNPLQVAGSDIIENSRIAAGELRRVAKACTQAWASCHGEVLHLLSGGLGSSIVLSCMGNADSSPAVTCLNYHSRDCDGDERYFARLAANHARRPLLEWERDNALRLEDILGMERSAIPVAYLNWLQVSRREARLAREIRADAIFSGAGGDELFFRAPGIFGVADYLRMRGLNRGFIEVALDAARMDDCSLWHIVRKVVRHRNPRRWNLLGQTITPRSLVADAVLAESRDSHELARAALGTADGTPPGKLWHASSLCVPQEYYDPFGCEDRPERVQPLISQPLMELCLRIPTYVLASQGRDRAIARHAFREDVPAEILRRRCKQGTRNSLGMLTRNLDLVRQLLLDGHLVSAQLLERSKVEAALASGRTQDRQLAHEILEHVNTEAWLRSWCRN